MTTPPQVMWLPVTGLATLGETSTHWPNQDRVHSILTSICVYIFPMWLYDLLGYESHVK